jgi:hypothetical protein
MKYLTVSILAFISVVASQAQTKVALATPKIYVDPATGFDAYLSDAAARNHVPITLTTQKNDADFEFDAISGGQTVRASNWSILWLPGNGRVWIRLVDLSHGGLVFACAVDTGSGAGHALQAAAESCTKRLRAVVNRSAHSSSGLKSFLLGAPEWSF